MSEPVEIDGGGYARRDEPLAPLRWATTTVSVTVERLTDDWYAGTFDDGRVALFRLRVPAEGDD